MGYKVDERMVAACRDALWDDERVWWVIGGACSGKSSVCRAIQRQTGVAVVDMDAEVYGGYGERLDPDRHPAMSTWFSVPDPFGWMLGMSLEAFEQVTRTIDVEMLSLFAEDMGRRAADARMLVDGGLWHASVVARVMPARRVVCMATTPERSAEIWNSDSERAEIRQSVQSRPDGESLWREWLAHGDASASWTVRDSRAAGIAVIDTLADGSAERSAERVREVFGWPNSVLQR